MKRVVLALCILVLPLSSSGQEITLGDSSVVNSISKQTSYIYDNKDTTFLFLTSRNLQKNLSCGTSITVFINKDTINRIVASGATPEGIYSAEYYLVNEKLVFAFATLEYFDEAPAGRNMRKNFKGFHSWDSRFYFTDEKIKYQQHEGIKDKSAIYLALDVLKDKRILREYIHSRLKD